MNNNMKDLRELEFRASALTKVITLEAQYKDDLTNPLILHSLRSNLAIASGTTLESITGLTYNLSQFVKDTWRNFWIWVRKFINKLYKKFKGEITFTLNELIKLNDNIDFINKRMRQLKHSDDYKPKSFKLALPKYRGDLTTKLINEFKYLNKLVKYLASVTNTLSDNTIFMENLLEYKELDTIKDLTKQVSDSITNDIGKINNLVLSNKGYVGFDKYFINENILVLSGKTPTVKKHQALSPANANAIINLTLNYTEFTYIEEFDKIFSALNSIISLAESSNLLDVSSDTINNIIQTTTQLIKVTTASNKLTQSSLDMQMVPIRILNKIGLTDAVGYDLNKEGYLRSIFS